MSNCTIISTVKTISLSVGKLFSVVPTRITHCFHGQTWDPLLLQAEMLENKFAFDLFSQIDIITVAFIKLITLSDCKQ